MVISVGISSHFKDETYYFWWYRSCILCTRRSTIGMCIFPLIYFLLSNVSIFQVYSQCEQHFGHILLNVSDIFMMIGGGIGWSMLSCPNLVLLQTNETNFLQLAVRLVLQDLCAHSRMPVCISGLQWRVSVNLYLLQIILSVSLGLPLPLQRLLQRPPHQHHQQLHLPAVFPSLVVSIRLATTFQLYVDFQFIC